MIQKAINYKSCFDVIGPIMIGPSSSHTAGAVQMGLLARLLLGDTPHKVICKYYESFAKTHQGHGTDFAIVSGVLGFSTNDIRVPNALKIAQEKDIDIQFIEEKNDSPIHHANTADLTLIKENKRINIVAASIGGGTVEVRHIEINNLKIDLTGPLPIILILTDKYYVIRHVKKILEVESIEILDMRLKDEFDMMLCAIELNSVLDEKIKNQLKSIDLRSEIYILDQQ